MRKKPRELAVTSADSRRRIGQCPVWNTAVRWIACCLIGSLWCQRAASQVEVWVDEQAKYLNELYLDLHRHPELSFQEVETAKRMARELAEAGAAVTTDVGGHGVVGVMQNGEGPTVLVRTDLDALPVAEKTNLAYASQVKVADKSGKRIDVMHACGHDIHMTCWVGVARYFGSHRDKWSGNLVFVGQPAEERGSGAKAMIEDGLFERFPKPDFALALHVFPDLPAGCVAVCPGPSMANVDSVDVTMYGRGGHGAFPHQAVDPIVEAAKFVLDLQTIISREMNPTESAVITVGAIHAGTKHNIISDSCKLQLTVRSYTDEVRQMLLEAIRRKAKAAAASANAPAPTVSVSEGTPALVNDPQLLAQLRPALEQALGKDRVFDGKPVMGGEDFSEFGRRGKLPTVMFALGAVETRRLARFKQLGVPSPSLHSAEFWPDYEPTIRTGVIAMSSAVASLVPKH